MAKLSLGAAVAAALILEGGVAARSKIKARLLGDFAISRPRHFFAKKLVGESFHVILMQAHARTGPVAVAGLEKMLTKVRWLLGKVSL